jgi:hypothetical protein
MTSGKFFSFECHPCFHRSGTVETWIGNFAYAGMGQVALQVAQKDL